MGLQNDLVGALEASADHFGDAVHGVLRLLDDGVHFGEGGRLAHRRVLDGELQLLDERGDLVDVVQQLLLQRAGRYLSIKFIKDSPFGYSMRASCISVSSQYIEQD